ncbi:MAG: hypothetical protein IJC48_00135 [Clostridia bacterium]|nr:hypothetical protein [Clostridia bacterium]MBQ4156846.1 hypothetical protein [Clostridia bacterium]
MDYRTPLKFQTVLPFEGMPCCIEEVIGQGSNAIVYKGWYQDHLNNLLRHHVLVKELFPYHPQQKIYRAEDGHIVVEPEAEDLWATHKVSFEVGNNVHLRLLKEQPEKMAMGANLNSFEMNGTLYSVLGYTGGRSLQAELSFNRQDLRKTALRMIRILTALEAFHKSGYLHLDVSPDNIMLVGNEDNEQVFLIDYNSAREVGSREISYLSCKAGYSAPELTTGNLDSIGFASDLYSIAGVFYRSIMGRSLTLSEALQAKAPSGQDSPLLKDSPMIVVSHVANILRKGLNTLPQRRYQNIEQMRMAFQELLDRIDLVGITHWSLWENGKKSVEELIRINPSLRYLNDEKKLYPIRLNQEKSMPLEEYVEEVLSPNGKSGLILADGGMGKTTLLLHTAKLKGKVYSETKAAIFYISLSGWSKSDNQYILSQILMRLRFKKEENSFDTAMHSLRQLLGQTLHTKQGEKPSVLLLLDGLNEVKGDTENLIREINEINQLAGVRIIAASRSDIDALEISKVKLMPLEKEDVTQALGDNGLLIPESETMNQLLRTPLMLSIYIRASEGIKQLSVRNEKELMKAYMEALLEKEVMKLPEGAHEKWQIDAALNFVLPAIASKIKKRGKPLTERQLLRVVKKCRKTIRSWLMPKAFPQWIGHTRDIFHNTVKTDEWFAVIVHELLWQRFGMLMKDTNGKYRIFHHAIGDYLAREYRSIEPRTRTSANPASVVAIIWCLLLLFVFFSKYRQDLRLEMESLTDDYTFADLHISQDYWDMHRALADYAKEPSEENYQNVRFTSGRMMRSVFREFGSITDVTRMGLTQMDGRVLSSGKRDPEYIYSYSRSYLSDIPYFDIWAYDNVQHDYINMLCTLDVLMDFHRDQKVSMEDIEAYSEIFHDIHSKRGELVEYVGLWFEYPIPQYAGDLYMEEAYIEKAARELEALYDEYKAIFHSYPDELKEAVECRILLYYTPNRVYEETLFEEPAKTSYQLPSGWIAPDWMPENAEYYCMFIDPVTFEFTDNLYEENKAEYVSAPLSWYTVCFDVSKDDLYDYLHMLENEGIPITLNDSPSYASAFVSFPGVSLTINWTRLNTIVFINGIDSNLAAEGGNE